MLLEWKLFLLRKKDRKKYLFSRRSKRIYKAARKCGYLKGLIEPLDPRDAKKVSKNKILYLATGSQVSLWVL